MEKIFDSKFLTKKCSIEFPKIKKQEEFKGLDFLPESQSPLLRECQSPALRKKSNKKPDFSSQKIHLNLSINTKRKSKTGINNMVRSMMPVLFDESKKDRYSNKDKDEIMFSSKTSNEELSKRLMSHTRHPSLTYSKRNKYISHFDGKSSILSKIIRPSESNDNSLMYIEQTFGTLNPDMVSPETKFKPSKNYKEDFKGKGGFGKSSFYSRKNEKNVMKENDGKALLLTIKKSPYENIEEEEDNKSRKMTLSQEEIQEKPNDFEESSNIFNVEFGEKERRIYDFLETENVVFVIVDQLEKYNEKLQYKKLIAQNKVKPMSPLMQRRQKLNGATPPKFGVLNLRSCLSSDNLENILDINLDIK